MRSVFEPTLKPIYEGVDTLFIGSSILRKVRPFQIDKNMQVHSFSGSTTNEKIRVLNQYPEQNLDVFVIHDDTNVVLKHKRTDPRTC